MNEPLNTSTQEVVFTGKTYNKHPHWYNQPLRLTEEQLNNPFLGLDDFFECYHLNETRELLWQWFSAVISSPGSISSEPLERSNHIYFYERIEELIEAAFVIKTNQNKVYLNNNQNDNCISNHLSQRPEEDLNENFQKPKRLIEYVNEDPIYVIKEVFNPKNEFTSDQIKAWLSITFLTESCAYDESEQREQLKSFHDDLLLLTDALYVIHSRKTEDADTTQQHRCAYKISVLSQEQIANPEKVIIDFIKKYPQTYIDREMEDWLEAGLCYTGKWPDDLFCRGQLLDTHRSVLCLIKSAEQLLKKESPNLFNKEV